MDKYRKFVCEMTALMVEMNRSSGSAKDGMVPVDYRLFAEAVRTVGRARDSMNHDMEFKTGEAMRSLQNRFKLADGTPQPKPAPKKSAPAAKADAKAAA